MPSPGRPASSPWKCGSAAAARPPWPAPAGWRTAGWDRPCRHRRPATARQRIEQAAAEAAGRIIDPEHFGLSIPYATKEPDQRTIDQLRSRRPDADVAQLIPVGPDHLRRLVAGYVDAGLSKFVVRAAEPGASPEARLAGLKDLADLLLPLQT